jgi:D-alanyl-D-alanine dipeptidase
MSATISSNGGLLKSNPFTPPNSVSNAFGRALILILAIAAFGSTPNSAQAPAASSTSLEEFVGTYKQQTSEKRLRVLEKDNHLVCETADGSAILVFHLLPAPANDAFEITESSAGIRQQIKFLRNSDGKITGLSFAGDSYLRLPSDSTPSSPETSGTPLGSPAPFPGTPPRPITADLRSRTGDFANQNESDVFLLLERSRRLILRDSKGLDHPLNPLEFAKKGALTSYTYSSTDADGWVLAFEQRGSDPIFQITTQFGPYHRLAYSVPLGSPNVVRIKPARPLAQLRSEALAATPPEEKGSFRKSDLVELGRLDGAIRLDIRYASSNNFLGTPVYTQFRAFLQRPAAEALLRAMHRLHPYGFGLLIHDGYRPWYVTKIFWDATGPEGKIFVADPAQGSRHNRGCAVDLSLYDLRTDQPVEMTGLYDEMSPRSFPDYPGGTSLQRWRRDLLRWAMESEGFTVFDSEWWHFDYQDWREYAIQNIPFEKLDIAQK